MVNRILSLMDLRKAKYEEYIEFAYNLSIPWHISDISWHITFKEEHLREFWHMIKDNTLGGKQYYSLEWIREHKDEIKWELLFSDNTKIDHRAIYEFYNELPTNEIIDHETLNEDEMEFLMEKVILTSSNKDLFLAMLCAYQTLSEEFIEKYIEEFKPHFEFLCRDQKLSEPFMEKYIKYLDWDKVSMAQEMSEEFMDKHEREINWDLVHGARELSKHYVMKIYNEFMNNKHYRWVAKFNKITEKFLVRYWDRFKWDWDVILPAVELSEDFIATYGEEINRWDLIAETQNVSEEYLAELIQNYKDFDLSNYVLHANVSEDFLRNNFEIINKDSFWNLTVSQHLSESFIREFREYLDLSSSTYVDEKDINYLREFNREMKFSHALFNQPLKEKTIEEFKERLNWDWVSQRCKLSEQFIEKWSEKITWNRINTYQDLSEEFLEKHFEQIFNGEVQI